MTDTNQRPLASGEMIDIYRIESVLGSGGFGITYLATDTKFERQVAIKEYFPQNAWRDTQSRSIYTNGGDIQQMFEMGLERFHREGKNLAKFKHPNIVGAITMVAENSTAYLVMDYEHGETLETYMQRLGRPLNYEEAESIFNPLLDGLRAVHDKDLLHLDIKPANIFLRSTGSPVLIDFGGARHQLGQASRAVSYLVASDGYAPSEQYAGGQQQLSPVTDVYAVGACLYYCISGQIPAEALVRSDAITNELPDPLIPLTQLVPSGKYPELFLQTIQACLNMRSARRPQSIRELQARLFQAAEPTPAPIPPHSSHVPTKNNNLPLTIIGGLIAILLGGILINMNQSDDHNTPSRYYSDQNQQNNQASQQAAEQARQEAARIASMKEEAEQTLAEAKRKHLEADVLLQNQQKRQNTDPKLEIRQLIAEYTASASSNNIGNQLRFYTNPVDYYNQKNASHTFIEKDASRYIKHYPIRQFELLDTPQIEILSNDQATATFRMTYTLTREKDSKTLDGINLMKMHLEKENVHKWKINSVSSKKLN